MSSNDYKGKGISPATGCATIKLTVYNVILTLNIDLMKKINYLKWCYLIIVLFLYLSQYFIFKIKKNVFK